MSSQWITDVPPKQIACRIMWVSASLWLQQRSEMLSDEMESNFQYWSCIVRHIVLSPSFSLNSAFFHWQTRNWTSSLLFDDMVKNLFHLLIWYPGMIFFYLTPSNPEFLSVFSAFLIEISWQTSKTTSVCLLLLLVTMSNTFSATTLNVAPGGKFESL